MLLLEIRQSHRTGPYMLILQSDLGVGMIVPNEKENMWIFLKPLSADLWITSFCFFVVTGLVVWLIERPINQEFQGSPSQQIGTIFWFSFSTLVFAHREKLSNNLAKFVVIVWLFVVLILNSSYTATLASMMTVKQIQFNSKVNSIGYQIGTFTKGPIDLNFKGLKQFIHSEEEYADALSRGSKHGGASAIIDEIPYIKIFLAKYSAKFSMIKTKSTTNGFAFVFPKGSKLVHDISRQIETLREEGKLLEMEEAWFQRLGFDCGDFSVISVRSSGGIMSRRWIQNPNRCSDEYLDGIEDFIEFARRQNPGATRIRCPCRSCNNTLWETIENVGFHLVRNGMIETYSIWNLHGEQLDHASSSNATRIDSVEPIVDPNDQVMDIIEDVFPFASTNINNEREDDVPTPIDSAKFEQYEKLLKNTNQELYPGCESFSVLTAIVELMHGKIKYRMSNLCFDYFLGVFKRMLPTDNCLPKDHKQAQKVLNSLGLGYEKIHACKNNCMLFYKEHEMLDTCLICNESRFKMTSQNRTTKIPQKVMRYLPLKHRLQRLYMSTHTATDKRWHKEKRVDDDVMRHPADGEAWKEFDRTFPKFAADPRNVRLGLATDGFNPYGVLNQHHSTWPIFVFPYNLPPWKCMKKEYIMMTVLVTEDPGRSIDIYLSPLVDELKDLWTNGVRTYDKSTGKMFTLRAAVMWTVNDFPAYAMVSGWSTKGYMACPVCKEDVTSGWHAGKVCYLGHRRWLPWDHEWREKDKEFDGNTECRLRLREWSGDEIVEQLNHLDFAPFGKTVSRTRPSTHMNWTHKPMFFELPYWSKLKLRHNLDVMHVEKNVFDTLVGTILDIDGKTKDTIKARLDLERMGI
ncbi:hypothetical protein L3X38_012473 [Prunus dulcis]|uniref:Ionotropic glutamate receptor C-terminal domain-containing protein n=1 Tax=Prunus dulcis TaxID=3755 RepID=A0AAD4WLU0_PRUDU|nr:hypothetical protein L3X38_012473 [Prunus dulcis]